MPFDGKKCCIFEFPNENNSFSEGYSEFIVAGAYKVSDEVIKVRWPMCDVVPPGQIKAALADSSLKWKTCPAKIIAVGTYAEMAKAATNKALYGTLKSPSKQDRKTLKKKVPDLVEILPQSSKTTTSTTPSQTKKKNSVKKNLLEEIISNKEESAFVDSGTPSPKPISDVFMPLGQDVITLDYEPFSEDENEGNEQKLDEIEPDQSVKKSPYLPAPVTIENHMVTKPDCEDKPDCEKPNCEDKPDCEKPDCEDKPDCEKPDCEDNPDCEDKPDCEDNYDISDKRYRPTTKIETEEETAAPTRPKRRLYVKSYDTPSESDSDESDCRKSKDDLRTKIAILKVKNKRLKKELNLFKSMTNDLPEVIKKITDAAKELQLATNNAKRRRQDFASTSSTSTRPISSFLKSPPTPITTQSRLTSSRPTATSPRDSGSNENDDDTTEWKLSDILTDIQRCKCNHKKPKLLACDLLMVVFKEATLLESSLTGGKSRLLAPDATPKSKLNPKKVKAIIDYVQSIFPDHPEAVTSSLLKAIKFKLNNLSKKTPKEPLM